MKPLDTNSKFQEQYDKLWIELTPQERFLKGVQLILLSREMHLAGIRSRFPHFSEKKVREQLTKELYENR